MRIKMKQTKNIFRNLGFPPPPPPRMIQIIVEIYCLHVFTEIVQKNQIANNFFDVFPSHGCVSMCLPFIRIRIYCRKD